MKQKSEDQKAKARERARKYRANNLEKCLERGRKYHASKKDDPKYKAKACARAKAWKLKQRASLPPKPDPITICSVDGCGATLIAKGFCDFHYNQFCRPAGITARLNRERRAVIKAEKAAIKAEKKAAQAELKRQKEEARLAKKLAPKPPKPPRQIRLCSVDGCGREHAGKGFCSMHKHRFERHGDPLKTKNPSPGSTWKFVQSLPETEECIKWPFSNHPNGYGAWMVDIEGIHYAHAARAVCAVHHGPPPFKDAVSMHSCGNGHLGCVNPRHLSWGTKMENYHGPRRQRTYKKAA